MESIPTHVGSKVSLEERVGGTRIEWAEDDMFLVDLVDRKVTVHRKSLPSPEKVDSNLPEDEEESNQITHIDDPIKPPTPTEPCTPPSEPEGSPQSTNGHDSEPVPVAITPPGHTHTLSDVPSTDKRTPPGRITLRATTGVYSVISALCMSPDPRHMRTKELCFEYVWGEVKVQFGLPQA